MKKEFKYKRKPILKAGDIIGFRYDAALESIVLEVKGETIIHSSTWTNNIYESNINDVIKKRIQNTSTKEERQNMPAYKNYMNILENNTYKP